MGSVFSQEVAQSQIGFGGGGGLQSAMSNIPFSAYLRVFSFAVHDHRLWKRVFRSTTHQKARTLLLLSPEMKAYRQKASPSVTLSDSTAFLKLSTLGL